MAGEMDVSKSRSSALAEALSSVPPDSDRLARANTTLHPSTRRWLLASALLAVAAGVFLLSLAIGSAGIGPERMLHALSGSSAPVAHRVLIELRLPRVAAGFAVGGLLALAGVLMQALFRNALADPYVLGVSGGAAVGAIVAMALGA